MLAIFVIQFIVFILLLYSDDGLGVILHIILITRFTGVLGIIFGIIGTIKETGRNKVIPILTLCIGVGYIGFILFLLYGVLG